MKTIALKIHVTTEDGEVLESAIVVSELDVSRPLDTPSNTRRLETAKREAASTFESALRIAFSRAKKSGTSAATE